MKRLSHLLAMSWNVVSRVVATLFSLPFHPILLAIAPILFLFQQNSRELQLYELNLPLSVAICVSCGIFLVFTLLYRNLRKGALAASVVVMAFYGYSYIKDVLHIYVYGFLRITQYSYPEDAVLSRACLIGIIITLILIYARPTQFRLTTTTVNIFSFVLVLLPMLRIAPLIEANFGPEYQLVSSHFETASTVIRKPDIYYIVPEDYASNLVLQHFFHFDNSNFTAFLQSQGFTVHQDMLTNYPISSMSIASTLSMDYVQSFTPVNTDPRGEISMVFPRLQDPAVGSYLQQQGYSFIQMSSWYGPTRTSDIADENINFSTNHYILTEFQTLLVEHSMLGPYLSKGVWLNAYQQQLEGLNYQFNTFGSVINSPRPKFVFAHIIMPHEPTVYGKDCNVIPADKVALRTPTRNYLGQIGCLNRHLKTVIGQIRKSDPSAAIILQSDEGAPGESISMKEGEYAFANAPAAVRLERTSLLSAWYLPKPDGSQALPTQTPVNTFRILFNTYFGTKYSILPDKTYLMPDTQHLFDFIDATNQLHKIQATL